jgi:predicted MFS family arabinose efflux permease
MSAVPSNPAHASWLVAGVAVLGAFTTAVNTALLGPLLTPIAADFDVPVAAAGQLTATTAASAALTAVLAAPYLDRIARGTWLRVECLILAAGTALTALAPGLGWLFVGRALAGIGGAFVYALCLAAVADLPADERTRNRAIGLVGTGATLGIIVGLPVVAEVDAAASWRWATAAYLPLVILLFAGTFVLSGAPPGSAKRTGPGWASGYAEVLSSGQGMRLQGANIAVSTVWFGWLIYLSAYAREEFRVGPQALGLLFAVAGLGEVVGNNAAPVALRAWPESRVGAAFGLVLAADLLGVGLVFVRDWSIFPFAFVASLAGAALFTVISVLILDDLPHARGASMALMSAGFEVGGLVGAGGTGAMLAVVGAYAPVYRLLGIVALVAAWLLLRARWHDRSNEFSTTADPTPAA